MSAPNPFVKEYLQQKDTVRASIPESYRADETQKKASLITESVIHQYYMDAATKCMKPCFTSLSSPVVSANESECMTNCTTKAMETLSIFHLGLQRQ